MVDVAAMANAGRRFRKTAASGHVSPGIVVAATVHSNVEQFLDASAGLDLHGPAQGALWVSTWLATNRPDAILVTVEHSGKTVFALGLQTLRKSSFKIARVLGLTHANGNFFPLSSALEPVSDHACMEAVIRAVRTARPDVHALVFERQLDALRGRANPVLTLPSQISPNIALSVDLTPGFQAVLDIGNGQRKRKRHRYQARRLEAIGAVRHLRPRNGEDAARIINAFLDMKAARLRQMGLPDVFGPEPARAFFRTLFGKSATNAEPAYLLDALEVGGKIRAVTGSSVSGDRLICDFAGFVDDESAIASPGDFLLHENIENAVADGFAVYDLGVGDEPYKRSWCDIETSHYDVFVPLTPIGSGLVAAQRARTRLKAAIKANPVLWPIAKAVRGKLARSAGA